MQMAVMATKHLLSTILFLAVVRSADSQSLGGSEYIGIAFGAGGLLCILATLAGLCCGLCCCCGVLKRDKRKRGTMLYSSDGRPITYVKNAHSANAPLGSPEYNGVKMYNNTQTFQTFVPSYQETRIVSEPNQKVGFARTTYVARPSQVSQVIQDGPAEPGYISPSVSFSDQKPTYTATVGPNRTSVGSFSNPTFSRSSTRTSLVLDPNTFPASTAVTTTTTTKEETTEETKEETTLRTHTRRSFINRDIDNV